MVWMACSTLDAGWPPPASRCCKRTALLWTLRVGRCHQRRPAGPRRLSRLRRTLQTPRRLPARRAAPTRSS